MAKALAPERQRVQQRFADNPFFLLAQRLAVPNAPQRAGQVQMRGRVSGRVGDSAAIELRHRPAQTHNGEHHRAGQMLVAGLTHHAQTDEQRPQRLARVGLVGRHLVAQAAIGITDLKGLGRFGMKTAAPFQITHRLWVIAKSLMVKFGHAGQRLRVGRVGGGVQQSRAFHAPRRFDDRHRRRQPQPGLQLLRRARKGHPLLAHDELQVVAPAASGQAVPQVFRGRYPQTRLVVVVERTAPHEVVRPRLLEFNARFPRQIHQRHFALDAVNDFLANARHSQ